jgi:hypothetical protein
LNSKPKPKPQNYDVAVTYYYFIAQNGINNSAWIQHDVSAAMALPVGFYS